MRRALAVALAVLALGLACRSGTKEDPILKLSAEESLAQGKALLEAGKYKQAEEYLTHAFEVAPNSAAGREGLLLAADALYRAGGEANFIKAEAKYRDFQNRFPTSDRAAYVQFQLASCLAKRVLRPDRDQTATRKAVTAYEEFLRLFPTSEYVSEARTELAMLRANLAEHEFIVGRTNFRRRLWAGARWRFETLLEEYPDYVNTDAALYYLVRVYRRLELNDEATAAEQRLRTEFPDSEFIAELKEVKT